MRNGQGWSMYLNSLYFCSAYRKLYSSFFCCISCRWWLIFPLSFLHCLQSSYLWVLFFFYHLAGWSCHSASKGKYWFIWSWSSCPGRSYRELLMFVLVLWWNAPTLHLVSRNSHTLWLLGEDFYLWFLLQPTIGKYPLNTLKDYWQSRKKVLLNFLIFKLFEIVATVASIWVLRKVSYLKQGNSNGDVTWLMGAGWAEMGSLTMGGWGSPMGFGRDGGGLQGLSIL